MMEDRFVFFNGSFREGICVLKRIYESLLYSR